MRLIAPPRKLEEQPTKEDDSNWIIDPVEEAYITPPVLAEHLVKEHFVNCMREIVEVMESAPPDSEAEHSVKEQVSNRREELSEDMKDDEDWM